MPDPGTLLWLKFRREQRLEGVCCGHFGKQRLKPSARGFDVHRQRRQSAELLAFGDNGIQMSEHFGY